MSVKALDPDATVKVFYMDIRAMGKGFEEYYRRAKSVGVEFENCRVAGIEESNGILQVSGESGGVVTREEFDLVVLSTGLIPSAGIRKLADTLGVEIGPFGFIQPLPQGRSRVKTSRPGIFVCGGAAEPQDVPTSVMWAAACALQALRAVGPEADSDELPGSQEATSKEAISAQPGRRRPDSSTEPACAAGSEDARIGIFVCKCDSPMTWLRLDEVVEAAKALDGVALVREIPGLCRGPALESLRAEVAASGVNRVVVAACSPRDILHLVERGLSGGGAWHGLVEVANIREQCAWVHREGEAATRKAQDLVAMAVEQVRFARPLREQARAIPSSAVVIGGGPAGMQAASSLADLGHEVHLVEKDAALGGRA
ncbi:MAG: FAD-dependent oxidoreductase, partial [Bacillota bacterium]